MNPYRKVPYLKYLDAEYRINNLHIHSKHYINLKAGRNNEKKITSKSAFKQLSRKDM